MKNIQKIVIISILALVLILSFFIYVPEKIGTADKIEINIEKGSGSTEIANVLKQNGLIRSRYAFWVYLTITGKTNHLQAGRYKLSPAMNIPTIVGILNKGLAEPEGILVTITEGTNVADIGKILEKVGIIGVKEFLNSASLAEEGYLFPDTYRFKKQTPASEIISKMKSNFEEKIKEIPKFQKLNLKEKKETIIIASILEKEVRTEEDMRLVAGIIQNRLAIGMPLQIDAVVAYGACFGREEISKSRYVDVEFKYCDVSKVNLVDNIRIDSVYNTYKREGLPPGPISNPGLKAIGAALNPAASDYLYYLNTADGQTIFSKTAAEHEKARKKYLK